MGFFFKKRKEKRLSIINAAIDIVFPGGQQDFKNQISELKQKFEDRYDEPAIGNTLYYVTKEVCFKNDKSANTVVHNGVMLRRENKFSEADAIILYKFVIHKLFERKFQSNNEQLFQQYYESFGNIGGGAVADEIPGAYGEFGLCATNPVSVRGIDANEVYLKRLSLISGKGFTWDRIGSTCADNIEMPIDMYLIKDNNGIDLCTIFISSYQSTISNRVPKGFCFKSTL